jgi:hypothetical protein
MFSNSHHHNTPRFIIISLTVSPLQYAAHFNIAVILPIQSEFAMYVAAMKNSTTEKLSAAPPLTHQAIPQQHHAQPTITPPILPQF